MQAAITQMQQRIDQALAEHSDNGALLRVLFELAAEPEFRFWAAHWSMALYNRDPVFFENFLLRHFDAGMRRAVIEQLLWRAEADGHDSLFQGLYRQIAIEPSWDEEIRALAATTLPDATVLRAVRRRMFKGIQFGLKEQTALALYRRNPALFGQLVFQHVRDSRHVGADGFAKLRAEMVARGDEALALALFRAVADDKLWAKEVRQLLARQLSPEQIVAALRERHPERTWHVDGRLLATCVERYGAAVLPYIEQHVDQWLNQGRMQLLAALRATGDESFYWRLFFRLGNDTAWNKELRALLKARLDDAALSAALQQRTPAGQRFWWPLQPDVALALYRRLPLAARPLIERFAHEPPAALWAAAEDNGDEELLDVLCFRALVNCNKLLSAAFPKPDKDGRRKPNRDAVKTLQQTSAPALERLDRLAKRSPEDFVRHAAAILSYVGPFEIWDFDQNRRYNPILIVLLQQHRDAWLVSPAAMRELLESPNIFVQIIGLELLAQGGPAAAQRTVENLLVLRALLLGRARKGTKRQVLICLEQAARQGVANADAVLPLLAEAAEVRGRRAVDLRAMVGLVRLRHAAEVG